jgi:hypothetical protein
MAARLRRIWPRGVNRASPPTAGQGARPGARGLGPPPGGARRPSRGNPPHCGEAARATHESGSVIDGAAFCWKTSCWGAHCAWWLLNRWTLKSNLLHTRMLPRSLARLTAAQGIARSAALLAPAAGTYGRTPPPPAGPASTADMVACGLYSLGHFGLYNINHAVGRMLPSHPVCLYVFRCCPGRHLCRPRQPRERWRR